MTVNMNDIDWISVGYAGLITAGGVYGYVKLGSVHSLPVGFFFGGVLGVGAYLTSNDPNNYMLTLATSAALTGLTGHRYLQYKRFLPMGLMAVASGAMTLKYGYQLISTNVK